MADQVQPTDGLPIIPRVLGIAVLVVFFVVMLALLVRQLLRV